MAASYEAAMLTRMVGRATVFKRQGRLALLVAAMMAILATVAGSFMLTPDQQIARDFGIYEDTMPIDPPGLGEESRAFCDEIFRPAGATHCDVNSSFQIAAAGVGRVTVLERRAEAYPEAFTLLSGRWPAHPGEVVVSEPLPEVERLDAADGAMQLRVVGRFRGIFDTSASDAVAAPGTWAATSGDVDPERFPGLTASSEIAWSGVPSDAVAAVFGDEQVLRPNSVSDISERDVIRSLGLVGQLPLVLLPLMTGVLAAAWTSRWRTAVTDQLLRIGIARRVSSRAMVTAGLVKVVSGGAVGLIAGWLVSTAARPLLGAAVAQPLAPIEVPWQTLLIVLAGLVGGYLIALIRVPVLLDGAPTLRRFRRVTPILRRVLVVGLSVAVVARTATTSRAEDVTFTIVTAMLLAMLVTPDLIRGLAARRWRRPATRLGAAMLRRHTRRCTAMSVTLVAMLSFCGASTAAITTFIGMDNAAIPDALPPGMAAVGVSASYPLPQDLVRRFEQHTGLADPVAVTRRDVDQTGFPGVISSVTDVSELERLVQIDLPGEAKSLLEQGALLVRESGLGQVRGADAGSYQALPEVQLDYSLALPMGAVVLDAWAVQRGWAAIDVGYFYPDVSPAQLTLTQSAAQALGVDESFFSWSRQADQTVVTPAYATAMTALGLGLVLLLALLAGALGTELRPYLARLRSIGLPRSWARGVVLTQLLMIVGVAGAQAAAVTAVTVGGLIIVNGAPPAVPWQATLMLASALLVGVGGGVTLGTLRLRSTERLSGF